MARLDIDEVDVGLLQILLNNSRASLKTMAEATGVSIPTVRSRLKNLRQKGLVKFTALVDEQKLGRVLTALLSVKANTASLQSLREKIGDLDEVSEVYLTMGESDIIVKASFEDTKELESFLLNKLGKLEGILTVQSNLIIEKVKESHMYLRPGPNIKVNCPNCGKRIAREYVRRKVGDHEKYFCSEACFTQFSVQK